MSAAPNPPTKRERTHDDSVYMRFKPLERSGGGTWGDVFLARDAHDPPDSTRVVAVKRMRRSNADRGMKAMAQREEYILRALQGSPHVVALLDVLHGGAGPNNEETTFFVMERAQHDLRGLIECKSISARWTRSHVKGYIAQLLGAVAYCHGRGFMHRDLKPANVLVSRDNVLKLADYGLACPIAGDNMERPGHFMNPVCTLWYRAPEVIYGSRSYGTGVDMWAVGCIVGELLQNAVFLPGTSDAAQLSCIHALCGSPAENGWPEAAQLPHWETLNQAGVNAGLNAGVNAASNSASPSAPSGGQKRDFQRVLRTENKLVSRKSFFSEQAVALLDALLALNPDARPSAQAALEHPYFDPVSDGGIEVLPAAQMIRYNETSYFAKKK